MSVWISSCVDRVTNVLPQAHVTVAMAYCGWMSFFTRTSAFAEWMAVKYTRPAP
jgi:hypothetical protein